MPEGFPPGLSLTPVEWPAGQETKPGDEDRFLPRGFLLGAPSVVFPYRGMAPDHYYGAEPAAGNPLTNAPLQDACGGTVYFETGNEDHLRALVRLMGLRADSKNYMAFGFSAKNPQEDRYLDQIKFLTHAAVTTVFEIDSSQLPADQDMTLEDAIVGFVDAQIEKWDDPDYTFSSRLSGTAGGDGDWAKECLAFGLHVENAYWGSCRLWSRPWLVTK